MGQDLGRIASNANHHVGGLHHGERLHAGLQRQLLGTLFVIEVVIVTLEEIAIMTWVVVAPGFTVLMVTTNE